jgi:hypothetical protein
VRSNRLLAGLSDTTPTSANTLAYVGTWFPSPPSRAGRLEVPIRLTLARDRERLPDELAGVVAICPPLDMSACADALERRANLVYQLQFVTSLNASYRRRRELLPEAYEAGRERGVSTVRQFDDRITAFYGGYRDAEDYYLQVSPGPRLESIDRPALILAAADDPFVPESSMRKWARAASVSMEVVEGAGHVGFVGRSRAPGYFWAADRVLAFVAGLAG